MTTSDSALADCRLMVATPIYDGAQGSYVRAALDLAMAAPALGLAVRFEFILYQPCIFRARNMLADLFLQSDCTHLLFVDSDIDFAADAIVSLVRAMAAHADCAVLGAPVPRRAIHWGQVGRAARQGLGDTTPADLARYGGDFALAFRHRDQRFALTDLVELEKLGTGLMLIRRDVLEELRRRHPELAFRTATDERDGYRVGELVQAFFMPMIDPDTQLLLSDDYAFCRRVRDAGHAIWLAPWVRTTHSGPMIFQGSLADMVPLFASPSVSSPE